MNKKKQIDFTQFQHKPFKFMFFVAQQHKICFIITLVLVILAETFASSSIYFLKQLTDSINAFPSDGDISCKKP